MIYSTVSDVDLGTRGLFESNWKILIDVTRVEN